MLSNRNLPDESTSVENGVPESPTTVPRSGILPVLSVMTPLIVPGVSHDRRPRVYKPPPSSRIRHSAGRVGNRPGPLSTPTVKTSGNTGILMNQRLTSHAPDGWRT